MYTAEQKTMILRANKQIRLKLMEYITPEFDPLQIEQIMFGIEDNLEVSKYADKDLPFKEMKRRRLMLSQEAGLPYNYDSLSHRQLKRGVIFYMGTLSPVALNFFRSMHGYRLTQFRIGDLEPNSVIRGVENSRCKDRSQSYYFVIAKDDLIEHSRSEAIVCTPDYCVSLIQFPYFTPLEDRKDFIEDLRCKLGAQRERERKLSENIG